MNTSLNHALLRVTAIAVSLLGLFAPTARAAAPTDHWVGTWAAALQAESNATLALGSTDVTLREIVHVSIGGSRMRIVLSNEFGSDPLTIGAVHVALSAGGQDVHGASSNALTFSGHGSVTIPVGSMAVSDPIDLTFPAMSDLAVSLFLPVQTIHANSYHMSANQTNYIAPGNVGTEPSLGNAQQTNSWRFLKGVETVANVNDAAIVAFGDSITDVARTTPNANLRWPDDLARRLQADPKLSGLSVLNEGIAGNRVLHNGNGSNALARLDRDVLAQPSVKYLIILESINDIGAATAPNNPYDIVTVDQITAGLQQLVDRAQIHGIKVFLATLTPYLGANYHSAAGETMRAAVNDWIRNNKVVDGVIDFDLATHDPSNPTKFLPVMDGGDHLHPSDTGCKAMADAIDLKLFSN